MIIPQECYECKYYRTLDPEECSKYCKVCAVNREEASPKIQMTHNYKYKQEVKNGEHYTRMGTHKSFS